MENDELAIRNLVKTWLEASKSGDIQTVLGLMSDDVIFMVPGREPFGKAEFAESGKDMKGVHFEGRSDIQELTILGEWAWMRNRLEVTMTPPRGKAARLAGYTLTILRKMSDGGWVIVRDANLLTPKSEIE